MIINWKTVASGWWFIWIVRWCTDLQILNWYNWFSWWWEQGCSKHVENWNKYEYIRKKELCVKLVIYKHWTEMHGQQTIKFSNIKFAGNNFSCSGAVTSGYTGGAKMCVQFFLPPPVYKPVKASGHIYELFWPSRRTYSSRYTRKLHCRCDGMLVTSCTVPLYLTVWKTVSDIPLRM